MIGDPIRENFPPYEKGLSAANMVVQMKGKDSISLSPMVPRAPRQIHKGYRMLQGYAVLARNKHKYKKKEYFFKNSCARAHAYSCDYSVRRTSVLAFPVFRPAFLRTFLSAFSLDFPSVSLGVILCVPLYVTRAFSY